MGFPHHQIRIAVWNLLWFSRRLGCRFPIDKADPVLLKGIDAFQRIGLAVPCFSEKSACLHAAAKTQR